MLTSRREEPVAPHIIAIVELDVRKMRVRVVLTRAAIGRRLQELEFPKHHHGGWHSSEGAPDSCRSETMKQEKRAS
jgi:hypothetical protein